MLDCVLKTLEDSAFRTKTDQSTQSNGNDYSDVYGMLVEIYFNYFSVETTAVMLFISYFIIVQGRLSIDSTVWLINFR